MACTVSPYFTDDELEEALRLMFPYEEMYDFDFKTVFNQISDMGDYLVLRLRGRVFAIDPVTCVVSEVVSV